MVTRQILSSCCNCFLSGGSWLLDLLPEMEGLGFVFSPKMSALFSRTENTNHHIIWKKKKILSHPSNAAYTLYWMKFRAWGSFEWKLNIDEIMDFPKCACWIIPLITSVTGALLWNLTKLGKWRVKRPLVWSWFSDVCNHGARCFRGAETEAFPSSPRDLTNGDLWVLEGL